MENNSFQQNGAAQGIKHGNSKITDLSSQED